MAPRAPKLASFKSGAPEAAGLLIWPPPGPIATRRLGLGGLGRQRPPRPQRLACLRAGGAKPFNWPPGPGHATVGAKRLYFIASLAHVCWPNQTLSGVKGIQACQFQIWCPRAAGPWIWTDPRPNRFQAARASCPPARALSASERKRRERDSGANRLRAGCNLAAKPGAMQDSGPGGAGD